MPDRLPLAEYQGRLAARQESLRRSLQLDQRVSNARLAVVAIAATLAGLAFWGRLISPWWLLVPAVLFLILVVLHERIIRARDAALTAVDFYERGLARIEDRWTGTGEAGLRFVSDLDHPYAQDLDLFGRGSLFELLWSGRTRVGEATLAAWLTRAADVGDIRARQEAVEELRTRLDLREALAVAGLRARVEVETTGLVGWATAPTAVPATRLRVTAGLLSASVLASAAWWTVGGPAGPLEIAILLAVIFAAAFSRRLRQVLDGTDVPGLDALAHLFDRVEREPATSAHLSALRQRMQTGGVPASVAIRRLQRVLDIYDWRRNPLFAPVAAVLLWPAQFAAAFESWRQAFGSQLPLWLAATGEFEALGSLSAYAYEHPADPFPELLEGRALFDGVGLGHPLIAASALVRNDVCLMDDTRLFVVSGSNMSGKSTLLRTVGINAVLALAGAPVRAERLALTPLAVGATLRIQDSLQAGRSRFYAEVTRIRELLALADGPTPLLFLLDELFQGTNSHDRVVGAASLLRSLLDRGSIGLVTTHDLAVAAVTTELGGRAVNVHFEDCLDRGELAFDYKMRPGPVTRGNGLALMRAVGLDVRD